MAIKSRLMCTPRGEEGVSFTGSQMEPCLWAAQDKSSAMARPAIAVITAARIVEVNMIAVTVLAICLANGEKNAIPSSIYKSRFFLRWKTLHCHTLAQFR